MIKDTIYHVRVHGGKKRVGVGGTKILRTSNTTACKKKKKECPHTPTPAASARLSITTALLQHSYTFLLLYYCITPTLLLLYYCSPTLLLLYYCSPTLLLIYYCLTPALLLLYNQKNNDKKCSNSTYQQQARVLAPLSSTNIGSMRTNI
jgi:hypothetical protein